MKDDVILEAGRSIRPFLNKLIPGEAAEVDQELGELLGEDQSSKTVADNILALLRSRSATREWVAKFLEHGQPPEVRRAWGYSPTLGDEGLVSAPKFTCPHGDYTWYRMSAGEPVRCCPYHKVALIASS